MTPTHKAFFGLAGMLLGLAFVLAAHVVGLALDKLVENGLIVASAAAGGLGMRGFLLMQPPKSDS